MSTLGEAIRTRRIELGLTQEQLAEKLGDGVRQAEISRLEHDAVTLPRRERMERLASALDLPLGLLLASSGWTGAEQVFPPGAASESTPADGAVELEHVLDEAKEVVAHLEVLVDAAQEAITQAPGIALSSDAGDRDARSVPGASSTQG